MLQCHKSLDTKSLNGSLVWRNSAYVFEEKRSALMSMSKQQKNKMSKITDYPKIWICLKNVRLTSLENGNQENIY